MESETPVERIKGVGPKTAEQLHMAGIETVRQLVRYFPYRYEDYSQVISVSELRPGKVSLRGKFESVSSRQVRRGMSITQATFVDPTGKVAAVWFNQSYRGAQLKANTEFLVSGEFAFQRGRYQLMNPSVELASGDEVSGGRIVPVYRQVKGLKTQTLRKILFELRPYMLSLPETLPDQLIEREKLMAYPDAVHALHFPEHAHQLDIARSRMGFEELLSLMLASLINRADNESLEAHVIEFSASDAQDFVSKLPFNLTNAQRIAAWEAIQNLASGTPMNRLLQGDVGSGKTVVAGLVAYIAARRGFQTAFLAPTELLANQHADTLQSLLEGSETKVGLLTGSIKGKKRQNLLSALEKGEIDVLVGTHALLQDSVVFHQLGFVVIDEQHRFGVDQRLKLLEKSIKMPHLLAMTATPIPRSLQLTIYGELDISILNEKPKNRLPIETHIISPNSRAQMYEAIESQIIQGRQVYVICPLIAENTVDVEQKSVEAEYKRLQKTVFKHRHIGLLHGKLKSDDKRHVMEKFATGEIDILVSTTVVEVGVDVANATVIVIEDANQFGLAQLHQLRGRVGRSSLQSYCYLVTSDSKAPSRRLRELERSNDGFYLAERDLELRGPGEIYGRMQHGDLNLEFAHVNDAVQLRRVKRSTEWLLSQKTIDLVQYKQLWQQVQRYRRLTTLN
ncbi:ATP-dependent DNA helicase RecG [Candidatus Saccharibacteria bacterium]|nr:ATP-dependent DNA helicase RecG [Candidatus Saccharibacteria bacterium]NCU40495.1 ATP-dependent DNA helicase RecG [Candidatus Saccharibacteria bacterium]